MPVTHGAAMRFRVCGLTLNELFAYRVPLQAVVKDCRLGMLNYALMIGIFVYATWSPMEQFWGLLSYPEQVGVSRYSIGMYREQVVLFDMAKYVFCMFQAS